MIYLIVYSILATLYLVVAITVASSLSPAAITKWYKKALFHIITFPATLIGLISSVLSVKLAGESIFVKLTNWLKA